MGAVLCQAGDDDESREAEQAEIAGAKCAFDRTRTGLRLRPCWFLSRNNTPAESHYHSYVGEASVARYAFPKFRKYLLGPEFTWLADCDGLKRFFEATDDVPTHVIQRWRAELLIFNFKIEHRSESMMT